MPRRTIPVDAQHGRGGRSTALQGRRTARGEFRRRVRAVSWRPCRAQRTVDVVVKESVRRGGNFNSGARERRRTPGRKETSTLASATTSHGARPRTAGGRRGREGVRRGGNFDCGGVSHQLGGDAVAATSLADDSGDTFVWSPSLCTLWGRPAGFAGIRKGHGSSRVRHLHLGAGR